MERRKKKESSGFYIAISCCAVIIAIVGYASRMSMDEAPQNELAEATKAPAAETKAPVVTKPPQPTAKAEEAPVVSSEPASKNVEAEDLSFAAPVEGKVIGEYSGEDLVYNEALKDWRSHSGVDFAADIGEKVLCSADGVVEDVFDSGLGRCVVIDHQNGYKTMYANLSENTEISKGDELVKGDVVGIVGDTALGDSTDAPHLHFELMKKDENVNPVEYLE